MNERQYAGQWWIEGEASVVKWGALKVGDDGSLSLELIGGFDLSVRSTLPDGSEVISRDVSEPPVIHGLSEGREITLLNCFELASRWNPIEVSFQRLYAQRAIIGRHISSSSEAAFTGAVVRIENLTGWVALPAVSRDVSFRDGVAKAELRRVEPVKASYDGWEITAAGSFGSFTHEHRKLGHHLVGDSTTELRMKPPAPASLDEVEMLTHAIEDLLTLASNQACGIISLTLYLPEDPVATADTESSVRIDVGEVEVLSQRVHTVEPDATAINPYLFLFTCRDRPFGELIPNWLALRARIEPACNIFFGMKYAPPGYLETRLLLSAITVETLQRGLQGDIPTFDEGRFETIRKTILDALEDPVDKAWAKANLRNSMSFKERALSLASIPSPEATSHVIPDPEGWARLLRDARNGLAHSAGETLNHDIFDLESRTSALIALTLMQQLSLTNDLQTRAARNVLYRNF